MVSLDVYQIYQYFDDSEDSYYIVMSLTFNILSNGGSDYLLAGISRHET